MVNQNIRRSIAHFDLDSFFVSVERLKDSSLMGRPLIVGGTGGRGVVAACSYETRVFGVHSAMPMKQALILCPEAIVLRGDFASYSYYSRMVTDLIRGEVPVLEKASIDEFYMDLTGMDQFFGCSKFTAELKAKVMKHTGLPISYGLASNKLIAKIATNEAKPNGRLEIEFGKEKQFLAPMPISKMPGIGKKTSLILRKMGIETLKTLSEIPEEMLQSHFGKMGAELFRKANGIDRSPVVPYSEQKSIGKEETFSADTINMEILNGELVKMTDQVAFQLRRQHKLSGCVTVKLRYSNFETFTKQAVITYTASSNVLLQTAKELFKNVYDGRSKIRLLGVRLSHLVHGQQQTDLFDDTDESVRLYQALDHLRERFGENAVGRAAGV